MTRTIAAILALTAASGCAFVPFRHNHRAVRNDVAPVAPAAETHSPLADGQVAGDGACRLDTVKVLEGRPGSAVVAAQALDLTGARSIRWMHPGDVVTMDFRPDRLNIKLTHANIVKSFACG